MTDTAQVEQAVLADVIEHPKCGNWPPSRGPMPEWMTRKPEYVFPDPKLIDPRSGPEPDGLTYYSAWAQVTDLLEAGPKTSEALVVGAMIQTAEYQAQRTGEPASEYKDRPTTVKYLDIQHPGINSRSLVATLGYPLSAPIGVLVEPFTRKPHPDSERHQEAATYMTTGWLLWSLARAYEMIYADHEKHGIWGHAIGDLGFEQFAIDGDRVYVFVGS